MTGTSTSLNLAEARHLAVAAQGFTSRVDDTTQLMATVRCVQVDAISVIRRSHELVGLARGVTPAETQILGTATATVPTFEYWAHAISLLPVDLWPAMAYRRRRFRAHGWRGPTVDSAACEYVAGRLATEGPCTLRDLGGARGAGWERSSPNRYAAEWLQALGQAVVCQRRGNHRVFALADRVLPPTILAADEPDDETCLRWLTGVSLQALGVATTDDVADYFRLPVPDVERALRELETADVTVEGWPAPAWLAPATATTSAQTAVASRTSSVVPLSPFDSLVWYRPRQARLFGRPWLLEAYKPASKREFGYFSMPILAGTYLAGRIAARCGRDRVLTIEAFQWDHVGADHGPSEAVAQLRAWTNARDVIVTPQAKHPSLTARSLMHDQ